jgi:xanthine dehydrogenase accessory factor
MANSLGAASFKVLIRGGGDLASGVAWRLHQCGFRVYITEIEQPMAVRRKVSFCEAVYDGEATVEGVKAVLTRDPREVSVIWEQGHVPVLVDPRAESRLVIKPHVLVDAVIAKKNLGTSVSDAPLVIALGPGFEAGKDAHYVVETNRGHNLGRLLSSGCAEPDTGLPGPVQGVTADRVLRSPAAGIWRNRADIGDFVKQGDIVGNVEGEPVIAAIEGVLRGLIRPGIRVTPGLKIGDIDPRGLKRFCHTISEKAFAIAGGVLEGIMRTYAR